jgi:hypothetical protein
MYSCTSRVSDHRWVLVGARLGRSAGFTVPRVRLVLHVLGPRTALSYSAVRTLHGRRPYTALLQLQHQWGHRKPHRGGVDHGSRRGGTHDRSKIGPLPRKVFSLAPRFSPSEVGRPCCSHTPANDGGHKRDHRRPSRGRISGIRQPGGIFTGDRISRRYSPPQGPRRGRKPPQEHDQSLPYHPTTGGSARV